MTAIKLRLRYGCPFVVRSTYLMIALTGTILSVFPFPASADLLTPIDKSSRVSLVCTKRLLVPSRALWRAMFIHGIETAIIED